MRNMSRNRLHRGRRSELTTLMILLCCHVVHTYRIVDDQSGPPNTPANFAPYDPGFVARTGDSSSNRRYRVNPGGPLSQAQPNIFRGVLPRQDCPGMVGPYDGIYYCTSVEAGYCDRRSGACFCYPGYMGMECRSCRPTHYSGPNATCVPKVLCPNDCSGAGTCDAGTGRCSCARGRRGIDCSLQLCRLIDRWCSSCTDASCTSCEQGFYLAQDGTTCMPCTVHDPRCMECDAQACKMCADPLLTSIRRSGRRRSDPPLPWDEDVRILSTSLPFGAQTGEGFAEAEPFVLITDNAALSAHGVVISPLTPALACRGRMQEVQKMTTKSGRPGNVLLALLQASDMDSSETVGIPRRYSINCGVLAPQDAWYGFGATGSALEGPIEGGMFGSKLSPRVYAPGGFSADDGTSLVDVYGEEVLMSRIINDTFSDLLNGHPHMRDNTTGPLISGSGINRTRWDDYMGYKLDAVRGVLNSNDTHRNFSDSYQLPGHYWTRQLMAELNRRGPRRLFNTSARTLPDNKPIINATAALYSISADSAASYIPLLNASALACEQGIDGDDVWHCKSISESHVVCGNPGTIAFSSPRYVVLENDGTIAVTIKRTGGGLGRVTAMIGLRHVTTDDTDVSLSSRHATSSQLVFEPGVVALTIRLSIHDDRLPEPSGWVSHIRDSHKIWVAGGPHAANMTASSRHKAAEDELLHAGSIAGMPAKGIIGDGEYLLPAEWAALANAAGGLHSLTSIPVSRLHSTFPTQFSTSFDSDGHDIDLKTFAGAASASVIEQFNATLHTSVSGEDAWVGSGSRDWHAHLSPHESFQLHLSDVCCGASLGPVSIAEVAIVDDDGLNVHPRATVVEGALAKPLPMVLVADAVRRLMGGSGMADELLSPQFVKDYAVASAPTTVLFYPQDARGMPVNATRIVRYSLDAMNGPDMAIAAVRGQEVFVAVLQRVTDADLELAVAASKHVKVVPLNQAFGSSISASAPPSSMDDEIDSAEVEVEGNIDLHAVANMLTDGLDAAATDVDVAHGVLLSNQGSAYAATLSPSVSGLVRASYLHLTPGGVRVDYWDNTELLGLPVLTRVEQHVDHTWGLGPVFRIAACTRCGKDTRAGQSGPWSTTTDDGGASTNRAQPGQCSSDTAAGSDFSINRTNQENSAGATCSSGAFIDNVSARWTGRIRAMSGQSGWHTIVLSASGRTRLWLDGRLVLDAWGELSGDGKYDAADAHGLASAGLAPRPGDVHMLPTAVAAKTVCTYIRTDGSTVSPEPDVGSTKFAPMADVLCVQVDEAAAYDGSNSKGFTSARSRDRMWSLPHQNRPDLAAYALDAMHHLSRTMDAAKAGGSLYRDDTSSQYGLLARVWLNDNITSSLRVEYSHATGWASVRMEWVTPANSSAKPSTIPSDCLFSTRHVAGSPLLTYVRPGRAWATGSIVSLQAGSATLSIEDCLASTHGTGNATFANHSALAYGLIALDSGIAGALGSSLAYGRATKDAIAGVISTYFVAPCDSAGNARGIEVIDDGQRSIFHAQATLLEASPDVILHEVPTARLNGGIIDPGAGPAFNLSLELAPRSVLPNYKGVTIQGLTTTVEPVLLTANRTTGLLDAVVRPTLSGRYALSTLLWTDWSTYTHVGGSPSLLHVHSGTVDPQSSTVHGYGVKSNAENAVAGSPFVALILLRDSHGNMITLDNEEWCPDACCAVGGVVPHIGVVDLGRKGSNLRRFNVRVQATPVNGTGLMVQATTSALMLPLSLDATSKTVWNGSSVDVFMAEARPFSESRHAQVPVRVSIYASGASNTVPAGRASHRRVLVIVATWHPRQAGEYRVAVTMGATGAHVASSPYPQIISPGPVHGPACTLNSPTQYASAGHLNVFSLTARDANGNVRVHQNGSWSAYVQNSAQNPWINMPGGARTLQAIFATFPAELTHPVEDDVQASVHWTSFTAKGPAAASRPCTVSYLGQARYSMTCQCGGLTCSLRPQVKGLPIKDAPWIYHRPGNAANVSAAQSNAWGGGIFITTAGKRAEALVQLRDIDGNVLAGVMDALHPSPAPWGYPGSNTTQLSEIIATLMAPSAFSLVRLGGVRPDAVEGEVRRTGLFNDPIELNSPTIPLLEMSVLTTITGTSAGALPRVSPLPLSEWVSSLTTSRVGTIIGAWPGTAALSIPLAAVTPYTNVSSLHSSWTFASGSENYFVTLTLAPGAGSHESSIDYSWTITSADSDDAWAGLWPPSTATVTQLGRQLSYQTAAPTATHVSNSPGLLSLQYTVVRSGLYILNLSLPSPALTGSFERAMGFPVVVAVLPRGSDAGQTDVSGPALFAGVSLVPTGLSVIPRDTEGNRVGRAGAELYLWAVEVRDPAGTIGRPLLSPVGPAPGVFAASWIPNTAGIHSVAVYRAQEAGTARAEYWPGLASGIPAYESADDLGMGRSPAAAYTRIEHGISLNMSLLDKSVLLSGNSVSAGIERLMRAGPGWRVRWTGFLRLPSHLRRLSNLNASSFSTSAERFLEPVTSLTPQGGPNFTVPLQSLSQETRFKEDEDVVLTLRSEGGSVEVWMATALASIDRISPAAVTALATGTARPPEMIRVLQVNGGDVNTTSMTVRLGAFHAIEVVYRQGMGPGRASSAISILDLRVSSSALDALSGRKGALVPLSAFLHAPIVASAGLSPYLLAVSPSRANATSSTVVMPSQAGVNQEALRTATLAQLPLIQSDGIFAASRQVTLQVTVRDTFGNARVLGNVHPRLPVLYPDNFTTWAVLTGSLGAAVLIPFERFSITYLHSGKYDIAFTPTIAGVYRVYVALNPKAGLLQPGMGIQALAVAASGAACLVVPLGRRDAWTLAVASMITEDLLSNTVAYGAGSQFASANAEAEFFVQLRDGEKKNGTIEQITATLLWAYPLPDQFEFGQAWDVNSLPSYIPGVPAVPSPNFATLGTLTGVVTQVAPNGLYKVRYTPRIAGMYQLTIRLGGSSTAASPYAVEIQPAEAVAWASNVEVEASVAITSSEANRQKLHAALIGFGLAPAEHLGWQILEVVNKSVVSELESRLDSAGIRAGFLFGSVRGTYRVEGTGSMVNEPLPAGVATMTTMVSPNIETGFLAQGRNIILANLADVRSPVYSHSDAQPLSARLTVSSAANTVALKNAAALAVAVAAQDTAVSLPALQVAVHPPVIGRVGPLLVRLRDSAGVPLSSVDGNMFYVALVRERLTSNAGLPTWSPFGPAEPPIMPAGAQASGSGWTSPLFMPSDTSGAAGAYPSTLSIRGAWFTGSGFSAVRVEACIPHPAAWYSAQGTSGVDRIDGRPPVPAFQSEGNITAPLLLPTMWSDMDTLDVNATAVGAWRMHVYLLQPSASKGAPTRLSSHGLSVRFWRSRDAWVNGEAPAHSEVLAGSGAVSVGYPAIGSTFSALWTRPAMVPYTIAIWTGFLVPLVSAAYTLRLTCDGPCSLEIDGAQRIGHNGTHLTSGLVLMGPGADGLVTLGSGDGSVHQSLVMSAGQSYALRIALHRTAGGADSALPSTGKLHLQWAWVGSDNTEKRQAPSSGLVDIPAESLYWAGQHVLGSPVPVWAGSF